VTGRPYEVAVGRGLLPELGGRLRAVLPDAGRIVLVSDMTVAALLGEAARHALAGAGYEVVPVTVPAGEGSKRWEVAGEVLDELASAGLTRTDAVVALGGGVVGDLAGFAAAVFLRGVAVAQVPTTLLAQVDSSIGGKTGVDLAAGKNLAGAFWQPSMVLTDTSLLASLPEVEWRSGLAEVAKTAILAGEQELAALERDAASLAAREPAAIDAAVTMCVRYKAGIVAGDEREGGRGSGSTSGTRSGTPSRRWPGTARCRTGWRWPTGSGSRRGSPSTWAWRRRRSPNGSRRCSTRSACPRAGPVRLRRCAMRWRRTRRRAPVACASR
jgi:3-dehydroquinate synthetase